MLPRIPHIKTNFHLFLDIPIIKHVIECVSSKMDIIEFKNKFSKNIELPIPYCAFIIYEYTLKSFFNTYTE